LLGIFIDDRRDEKERVTSLAEYGEIVESGTRHVPAADERRVHRLEAGRIDPTIVKFERYAFDLSRFAGGPQCRLRRARAQSVGRRIPGPGDPPTSNADAFPRRAA
jgi:hypothetical protein